MSGLADPKGLQQFHSSLGVAAHLCLLHTSSSFAKTFIDERNFVLPVKAPCFVSSLCATKCQEFLFCLLFGSLQGHSSCHCDDEALSSTFSMLSSDW
jgi:hypothetical protein